MTDLSPILKQVILFYLCRSYFDIENYSFSIKYDMQICIRFKTQFVATLFDFWKKPESAGDEWIRDIIIMMKKNKIEVSSFPWLIIYSCIKLSLCKSLSNGFRGEEDGEMHAIKPLFDEGLSWMLLNI